MDIENDSVQRLEIVACPYCNYKANSNEQLKNHFDLEHAPDSLLRKCLKCSFQSPKFSKMLSHLATKHIKFREAKLLEAAKQNPSQREKIEIHKEAKKLKRLMRNIYYCQLCVFKSESAIAFVVHSIYAHSQKSEAILAEVPTVSNDNNLSDQANPDCKTIVNNTTISAEVMTSGVLS
jgi:hypothetical protein